MPTYDYRCSQCSQEFELFLSLKEREGESENKKCPHCLSQKIDPMMTFNGGILSAPTSPCVSGGCGLRGGCGSGCGDH